MSTIRGTGSDETLNGTQSDDRIVGRGGNDILNGLGGQDQIFGGYGADKIDGGEGDDRLYGGRDNDVVIGGGGNDYLHGGSGNDELFGGEGDDHLRGGRGDDKLDGGIGNDELRGGWGNDVLNGGEGDDKLFGGRDNDILNGGNGNDHLRGGHGDDILNGGEGDDILKGGQGNDELNGGNGHDELRGGWGNDVLNGGEGDDKLYGGRDNDVLNGGNGNDQLRGGSGDDALNGGAGNDELRGGRGNDVLDGGAGNDIVRGGRGEDTLVYTVAENIGSRDVYYGGSGRDVLQINFTGEEWGALNGDFGLVQRELIAYEEFIAGNIREATGDANSRAYQFQTFGLTVSRFENVEVYVDGELIDFHDEAAVVDPDNEVFANDDASQAVEDGTPVVIDVLANDDVADGVASVAVVSGLPAGKGVLTLNEDNTFTFDPSSEFQNLSAGETEVVSFTYEVFDNDGDSAVATAQIVVTGTNDAPIAINALANQASAEDEAVSFTIPADTFSDVDGDALTLSAALSDGSQLPAWLEFDPNTGTFTGTPPADYNGLVSVAVSASDGVASVSENFDLEITPVNDAPIVANALGDQASAEDELVSFTIPADTFSDVDGDALTLSASLTDGFPLPEWLAFDANTGSFNGTPPANYNGVVTVVVTASDGVASVNESFDLEITPVNDAPEAQAVEAVIQEDDSEVNEFIVESGPLTIANAGYFYVADFTTGSVTGVPRGSGALTIADVAPQNGAVVYINPNSTSWFITAEVFADGVSTLVDPNEINLEGYEGNVSTSNGILFLEESSGVSLDFAATNISTPDGDANVEFYLADVSYPGANGEIVVDVASSLVVVSPAIAPQELVVSANAQDVDDGDVLTYSVDDTQTLGSVVNNGDGTFTYVQNNQFAYLAVGETATDTFTYTVEDSQGATDTETVTITITGENDGPDAAALTAEVYESPSFVAGYTEEFGENLVPNAGFFYVADLDAGTLTGVVRGSGALTPDDVAPENGVVLYLNPNTGSWFFTAESYANGVGSPVDPNQITVDGYDGQTDIANNTLFFFDPANDQSINFSVEGLNTADGLADASFSVENINYLDSPDAIEVNVGKVTLDVAPSGQPTSVNIVAEATDIDASDVLTYTIDDTNTIGSVVNNGDGTFTYSSNGQFGTLEAGETATDWFTYTVDDGNSGFDTEVVSITINGTAGGEEEVLIFDDFELLA